MLIAAAEKKNSHIISWLLSKGIDVNQIDEEGNTALDILIRNKDDPYSDCVQTLVHAGASLNTQEKPQQIFPPVTLPPNL
jgi:ankyrin repeat protein